MVTKKAPRLKNNNNVHTSKKKAKKAINNKRDEGKKLRTKNGGWKKWMNLGVFIVIVDKISRTLFDKPANKLSIRNPDGTRAAQRPGGTHAPGRIVWINDIRELIELSF